MSDYINYIRGLVGGKRVILVGASVLICKGGKMLMQKRLDDGNWMCTSGGYMELGETTEDAAKRELFEETGLIANSLELLGVFSGEALFHTYPNGDEVAIVDVAYLCEDYSGQISPQADEVAKMQWFDINEMPKNLSAPSAANIKKCIEVLKQRGVNKC